MPPLLRLHTVLVALLFTGCLEAAAWVGMPFLYEPVAFPTERFVPDLRYRADAGSDPDKHRLDLFLPDPGDANAPWPVLVFVHGGGWTSGDRALRMGGRDVYRNIGRFFASRGVGTAVVSYRLQFDVTWSDQVEDVARAVAWVHENIAAYGGNSQALFLAGHSAGAYLATRVGFDDALPRYLGVRGMCALIPVSGAALDLADRETYELGAKRRYYERRFRTGEDWEREASPISFVTPGDPPTLVVYAENDSPALRRQARLLAAALERSGVEGRIVEVPDTSHYTVVLELSRAGSPATEALLRFVREIAPSC